MSQGGHILAIDQRDGKVVFRITRRQGGPNEFLEPVEIAFAANRFNLAALAEGVFEAFEASPPSGLDSLAPTRTSGQEDRFAAALTRAGVGYVRGPSVKIGWSAPSGRQFCFPDFVMGSPAWVAVFFDGCYFHGCPEHCDYSDRARRDRDAAITAALQRNGWQVVRVWEHDDFDRAATQIAEAVTNRLRLNVPVPILDDPTGRRPMPALLPINNRPALLCDF